MDLSTEAKVMLLGAFLLPKAKLTMRNEISVLSDKAKKGLDELVSCGLVETAATGIAVTYSLTEAGKNFDRRSIARDPFKWMDEHGRWPIAVPKGRK